MKSKILYNEVMSITGANVYDAIMDKSTPYVDLLIRESVQNSADAIRIGKNYGIIDYSYGGFKNRKFLSLFQDFQDFSFPFNRDEYEFLAITDTNTTGLLGTHIKNANGSNNLFNLVYDLMNKKGKDTSAGGSWGIGKSVYYRFGVGFCIFYTRTLESNKYINKLVITFIEDETKNKTIIKTPNNRGIAFFGDLDDNNNASPIYDECEIKDILDIFNQSLFINDEVGTKIIIPYLKRDKFENTSINDENCWWHHDFERNLEIAIQRWYFSRLNNEKFNGKYLKISINGNFVQLNKFFEIMQKMYNGEYEGCTIEEISSKSPQFNLGKLVIRKFQSSELFMNAPNNYPTPLCFFDVDSGDRNNNLPIIAYMRKPGMVITYEKKLEAATLEDGEFLIGIFVLNDESEYLGENLGAYIRSTEKANHKSWQDSTIDEYPNYSKHTPVKKIWNNINKIITSNFKDEKNFDTDSSTNMLRKKLGKLLMPPDGFGDDASVDAKKPRERGGGTATAKKQAVIEFHGFENNMLKFYVDAYLKHKDTINFEFNIKSGSKNIRFDEWLKMGFKLPCELSVLIIYNIKIGNKKIQGTGTYNFDDSLSTSKTINKSLLFEFIKHDTFFSGIKITNVNDNALDTKISFVILVKPIDKTYSIAIDSNVVKNPNVGETL